MATHAADGAPARPWNADRYQRVRLWTGIAGIGGVLVLLWAGAATGLLEDLATGVASGPAPVAGALAALALGVVATLVLAPVDAVAGIVAERRAGISDARGWFPAWSAGVAGWLALVAAGGAAVGATSWAGDLWWLAASVAVLVLVPAAAAVGDALARSASDPATPEERAAMAASLEPVGATLPRIRFARDPGDGSLNGGWAGDALVLSALCRGLVGRPELACLVVRELGHRARGDRRRGVALAALWSAAAPPLAALALSPDPASPGALVAAVAVAATTWSWIGLLVLPGIGRRQVLAADAHWIRSGGDPEVLRDTLELLAARNGAVRRLPPAVERIFHPVPSLETRLAAIPSGRTP